MSDSDAPNATALSLELLSSQLSQLTVSVDLGWTLIAAYLVFFMIAGFSMLESGSIRSKNTKNIVLKNVADTALGGVIWWLIGFAFAFGEKSNGFISYDNFAASGTLDYSRMMFHWGFASVCSAVVGGAMAERTQFIAYLVYTAAIMGWIYPLVAHWVWNTGGWLHKFTSNGLLDFAGGLVVHMTGGAAGLMGAIFLGPRIGRFDENGKPIEVPGHSAALSCLGVIILWFGWYGFNSGSTLSISGPNAQLAARVAVNTTLGACVGALTVLFVTRLRTKKYDAAKPLNGVIAGLVSMTSSCATVPTWAAVPISAIGALLYIGSSELLLRLRIDDPLDAAPLHLTCGAWGAISIGLFASKANVEVHLGGNRHVQHWGLFLGGGGLQLGVQVLGVLVILAWVFFWSSLVFYTLKKLVKLRVQPDDELAGLDNTKHGGPAYPDFQQA